MYVCKKGFKGSMTRSRFIIVNRESGIIDGLYLDRAIADKSAIELRELWPGFLWEVASTTDPYPPPAFQTCMGHVRAKKIINYSAASDRVLKQPKLLAIFFSNVHDLKLILDVFSNNILTCITDSFHKKAFCP